jgi:ABC-2 type transport system permease protein
MRTWWKLAWLFFRMSLLNEMAYRANFVLQIFQSLLNLATALLLMQTIFSYTSVFSGWHQPELLALIGTYFLVGGCINLVLQPSMSHFMKDVRQGTLDYVLLKPGDSQALVSIQRMEVWKLVDIMLGIILIFVAGLWGHMHPGVWEYLGFVITLLSGGAIIYAFLFFLSTLVFWYVRIENILVIFQSIYETGRWPVTIYPGWLRMILTFVVPVAFAITIPVQALIGQLSWYLAAGSVTLALVLLIGTRLFWKIGVRHYTGASS